MSRFYFTDVSTVQGSSNISISLHYVKKMREDEHIIWLPFCLLNIILIWIYFEAVSLSLIP